MMNKTTNDHLSRAAYVYVRQSTPGQLINNPESRRRQYGLASRAKALGWQNAIIVDEDSATPETEQRDPVSTVC
jgi:DNA invertase Pin-like site-specific DNA recombinase